jgi:hypothetical protein
MGQPLDLEYRRNGSRSINFRDSVGRPVNIVAVAKYWYDPILKHPTRANNWQGSFVLVTIDLARKRGAVCGQVTSERLYAAPTQVFTRPMGEEYYVRWQDLGPLAERPRDFPEGITLAEWDERFPTSLEFPTPVIPRRSMLV